MTHLKALQRTLQRNAAVCGGAGEITNDPDYCDCQQCLHWHRLANIDSFTESYIKAALFSSTDNSRDDGGDPLDDNYGLEDIAPETLERMIADCAAFQQAHGEVLTEEWCEYRGCPAIEYAGHDFWLNRCGHGCGFWDGDWREPVATRLDQAARAFGIVDLDVGDDGMIYGN